MAQVAINPAMLDWVLRDADLSVSDVAMLTNRSEAVVQAWLSGGALPTKGDVVSIAKRAGRSLHFFMLPNPPASSPVVVRFRSAIDASSADPRLERTAIRAAQRNQKIARWAAEQNEAPAVALPGRSGPAESYAAEIAKLLKWTKKDLHAAKSKTAVFRDLRARVEALGIVVIVTSMGRDNCRGFSLSDERAPLIAINSDYIGPSVKSFTLMHELGHLSNRDTAICHDGDSVEEKWCNSFAANFILPTGPVEDYFRFKRWTEVDEDDWHEQIRLTSNYFRVSWRAVAIKLRDMGLSTQSVVDEVFNSDAEFANGTGFADGSDRTRPKLRLDEFGSTFTRAVIDLRDAARLSEIDARRFLGVNGTELRTLHSLLDGAA